MVGALKMDQFIFPVGKSVMLGNTMPAGEFILLYSSSKYNFMDGLSVSSVR